MRALASRNYRLYAGGQCVSLLGNWMTATASLWLVYHLSGSPFNVGLVGFANMIPVFVLAPFAGVWIDRVDGLQVVRLTQVLGMLQSAAMAAFTFSGHLTVPILIGLSGVQGLVNALDFPARQTLAYRFADDRAPLDNVIALNSITFNLARLIGPAIAGFVIAAFGPGACYTVDALSYSAVLVALAAVRLPPHVSRVRMAHPLADLRDGVRYAWTHPSIRRLLLMVSVIALAGFAHTIAAPVFARDVFLGDARTLGFLMSATGAGSLLAGVFLSGRTSDGGLGRVVAWGSLVGGAGLTCLALHASLTARAHLLRRRGPRHRALDGIGQHARPEIGGWRQARTRHEPFHDGTEPVSDRQPVDRRDGGALWASPRHGRVRRDLPRRRSDLSARNGRSPFPTMSFKSFFRTLVFLLMLFIVLYAGMYNTEDISFSFPIALQSKRPPARCADFLRHLRHRRPGRHNAPRQRQGIEERREEKWRVMIEK